MNRGAMAPLLWGGAVLLLVFALARLLHGSVWMGASILLILFALFCAWGYARQALMSLRASTHSEAAPRRLTAVFVGIAMGLCSLVFSVLIPPMQSPDEYAHLARAYSLYKGEVFMKADGRRENQSVDKGFLDYMMGWSGYLAFKSDVQVTKKFEEEMKLRVWSENEIAQYNPAGAYFPALYAPAAVAMGAARVLDQPPWVASYWARFGMWAVSLLAVLLALCIVRSGFYLMCAVGMLPMSLAQLGSANLDSMCIGFSFLAIALMSVGGYGGEDEKIAAETPAWRSFGCWSIIALLVLAKPIFVVLLIPAIWFAIARRRLALAAWPLAILTSAALWHLHVAKAFGNPNPTLTGSPVSRLVETVLSPLETGALLGRTLAERYEFYWHSMVGILGWLDTPLSSGTYVFAAALISVAILAELVSRNGSPVALKIMSATVGVSYVIGTLLLLWVTWTPPGSPFIEGVQGRYFIPMLPVLALALGMRNRVPGASGVRWLFLILCVAFAISVAIDVPSLLLVRYWL